MDDIIYLLSIPQTQDATGVIREDGWIWDPFRFEGGKLSEDTDPKIAGHMVYTKVESVTRAEFYAGGRSGLNPEFKMTIFAGDYQGETVAWYHDKPYAIYRTYHVPGTDYLELYLERKGGTNAIS